MSWAVEAYGDEIDGKWCATVDDEAVALLENDKTARSVSELLGWLQAVGAGDAAPTSEPDAPEVDGVVLKYRCCRNAVMIFTLLRTPDRVLVLRFAHAASALPRVPDLAMAKTRLQRWEPDDGRHGSQ